MRSRAVIYDRFADLLRYPAGDFTDTVERCRVLLSETYPEAAGQIGEFAETVRLLSPEQRQELFVQTFDLNPVCVLEVGWHLYGDTYDRGTFLVTMRQHMRRLELPEDSELPDHLTHCLEVLGRMDVVGADTFATKSILPALEKMLAGMKGKASPYEYVLKGLEDVLTVDRTRVLEEVKHE